MKKKIYIYPTITIKIKQNHIDMIKELREKYCFNVSRLIRDSLEKIYKQTKEQERIKEQNIQIKEQNIQKD